MSTLSIPVMVFFLSALAAGCLLWAVFQPRLDGGSRASDRLHAVAGGRSPALPTGIKDIGRKRSVEDALRELAEADTAANGKGRKASLRLRLRQAGLNWSRRVFYLISALTGGVVYLATFAIGLAPLLAGGFAIGAGLMLPNLFLNFRRKRRIANFVSELPDALDVIVRGVRSGLPLSDCLKSIAVDAAEPVRSEFKDVVGDHTMGLPLDEAAARLPARVPVPEATYFAIVIAIQSKSGGSLSEALGNLSKVVRERKKMKNKIQAMSSEARASAMIIASLPFFVAGVLTLTSPDYIALLFETLAGNIIIAVAGFWMILGVLVMRKMIAFDY